jgi:hypothetical protein
VRGDRSKLAHVNARLRELGRVERLRRARSGRSCYFYFYGGDAPTWQSSGIYTNSLDAWTVEEVVAEMLRLESAREVRS